MFPRPASATKNRSTDANRRRVLLEELKTIQEQKLLLVSKALQGLEHRKGPPASLALPGPSPPTAAPAAVAAPVHAQPQHAGAEHASAGKRAAAEAPLDTPAAKRAKLQQDRAARVHAIFQECRMILKKLQKNKNAASFAVPVDPIKLGIPDYFNIIKHPMDLSTVQKRLDSKQYRDPLEFATDIRLIWENCRTYNPPDSWVTKLGKLMSEAWERAWGNYQIETKWQDELAKQAREEQVMNGTVAEDMDVDIPEKLRTMDKQLKMAVPGVAGGKRMPSAIDYKRPMSFEEKRRISADIGALPGEKMERVLEIISETHPNLAADDEDEIELDMDSLTDETLWRIREYVDTVLYPTPKKSGGKTTSVDRKPPGESGGQEHTSNHQPAPAPQGLASGSGSGSEEGVVGSTFENPNDHQQKPASNNEGAPAGKDNVQSSRNQPSAKPGFIKDKSARKADIGNLQNADAWKGLNGTSPQNPNRDDDEEVPMDNLFMEFKTREQKEMEKEQKRKEEEQRRRQEQEEQERKLLEMERVKEEEERRKLQQQRAAFHTELQGMAGKARVGDPGEYVNDIHDMMNGGENVHNLLGLAKKRVDDDDDNFDDV